MSGWAIENLFWASAAMLLVLLIRRPVADLLGARVAYWLWAAPALRLVAPPPDLLQDMFPGTLPAAPLLLPIGAGFAPAAAGGGGFGWTQAALGVWLAGAVLFLAYQGLAYRAYLRGLSMSLRSAGAHRGLPLMESEAVSGPIALGLLDRRIVVPASFGQLYSAPERQLALEHEWQHHARGDILANHAALLVLAVNWFNPIAWVAFRAFRADQELACDAAVAAGAGAEARSDYAQALVKAAVRPGLIAACPLNRADQLKRRLAMLERHRSSRLSSCFGGLFAAMLAMGMLAAPRTAQTQPPVETDPLGKGGSRVYFVERMESVAGAEEKEIDRGLVLKAVGPRLAGAISGCGNGNEDVVTVPGPNKASVMVMCAGGNGPPVSRAEALEQLRERVKRSDRIEPALRSRLLEQLRDPDEQTNLE